MPRSQIWLRSHRSGQHWCRVRKLWLGVLILRLYSYVETLLYPFILVYVSFDTFVLITNILKCSYMVVCSRSRSPGAQGTNHANLLPVDSPEERSGPTPSSPSTPVAHLSPASPERSPSPTPAPVGCVSLSPPPSRPLYGAHEPGEASPVRDLPASGSASAGAAL